jgi:hypothetical protein
MAATIAEGEMLQKWMGGVVNADAKTRAQQKHIDEVIVLDGESDAPPAITKTHTMAATAEEGAQLVGDSVDPDVKTRAQQRHIEEAMADVPKVAKVRQTRRAKCMCTMRLSIITMQPNKYALQSHTMTETLKEADTLLDTLGDRVDDDVKTRAQQQKKRAADNDEDETATKSKKQKQ